MSAESDLIDELARARASATQPAVTVDDCRRVVAMLRDTSSVDRATLIRCLEFLLAEQSAMRKRHQQEIREMEQYHREEVRGAVSEERFRAESEFGGRDM